jgi:hypothetical protein
MLRLESEMTLGSLSASGKNQAARDPGLSAVGSGRFPPLGTRPMGTIEMLEIDEFSFQMGRRPEQSSGRVFIPRQAPARAADRAAMMDRELRN